MIEKTRIRGYLPYSTVAVYMTVTSKESRAGKRPQIIMGIVRVSRAAGADCPLFLQTSRHQPRHAPSDQQHDEEAGRLQRHDEGDMLCGGGDDGESMPPGLVAR